MQASADGTYGLLGHVRGAREGGKDRAREDFQKQRRNIRATFGRPLKPVQICTVFTN